MPPPQDGLRPDRLTTRLLPAARPAAHAVRLADCSRDVGATTHNDHVITHGRAELVVLADGSTVEDQRVVRGWQSSIWRLTDVDCQRAVAAYEAILLGGTDDSVIDLLVESGIDLESLLLDDGKADITRSDVTEVLAAASMLARDGCHVDRMHMANIPKMSRKKSDSGLDVVDILLDPMAAMDDLSVTERITIASVKHTTGDSSGDLRYALAKSLTDELSGPYMAVQLRVVNARLLAEGWDKSVARRVYLFLRGFPDPDVVTLVAVAAVDTELEADMAHHATLLPEDALGNKRFRVITIPDIARLHEKCR